MQIVYVHAHHVLSWQDSSAAGSAREHQTYRDCFGFVQDEGSPAGPSLGMVNSISDDDVDIQQFEIDQVVHAESELLNV
jgi:hypothetical protein